MGRRLGLPIAAPPRSPWRRVLRTLNEWALSDALRHTASTPGRGPCVRRRDLLLIVPMPMTGVVAAGTILPGGPHPLAWVGLAVSVLAIVAFFAIQRIRPS